MRSLRRRVRDFDVYRWANAFIERLRSPASSAIHSIHGVSSTEEVAILTHKLRQAERLLLLLDYDGTLVPFASTPELAAPAPELKELLRGLAKRTQTSVHVLSGRTRQTLDHWLGDLPIGLHAEHGFWSRERSGVGWEPIGDHRFEWKEKIKSLLEQFTEATPGSLIEEKTAGLAWHYRMADPVFGEMHASELRRKLKKETAEFPIDLTWGDKVIEIRAQGINKGVIATRLILSLREPTTILAMGDDRTDEDLFGALDSNSYTVHVGPHPSQAAYRIPDPGAARSLLASLLATEGIKGSSQSSVANCAHTFETPQIDQVAGLQFSTDVVT